MYALLIFDRRIFSFYASVVGVSHIYILGWNTAHKFQTLPNYNKLFMPVILKHFSALKSYKNKLSV